MDSDDLKPVESHIDSLQTDTLVQLQNDEADEENEEYDEYDVERSKNVPDYEVSGVVKVTLDELTQTALGVTVGVDVTGEFPWKKIKKELLIDNMQVLGDESAFRPFIKQIKAYEDDEILIGYILDETNDEDEFYVCLTPQSMDHCEEVSEAHLRKQHAVLEQSITKEPRPWASFGSEIEVDESIVKYNRPLIKIEVKSKYPVANQPDYFLGRKADGAKDGYVELLPLRTKYVNVTKKRVDVAIQANPNKNSSFAQTVPRFPQNVWTQCNLEGQSNNENETDDHTTTNEIVEEEKHKDLATRHAEKEKELTLIRLSTFLTSKTASIERILKFNEKIDIYNLDYPNLVKDGGKLSMAKSMELGEVMLFTDFKGKNKYISGVAWHQFYNKLVALSYVDSVPCIIKYPQDSVDAVTRAVFGENPVLVWSLSDTLTPKLYLQSNREVISLSFCPFQENILVGGCVNGQIVVWDLEGRLEDNEEIELLTDYQESNRIAMNSQMGWMKKIHDKSVVRTTVVSNLSYNHSSPVTNINWLSSHFEITTKGKLKLLPENQEKSMQFVTISEDGTIFIWNIKMSSLNNIPEKLKESKRISKRPDNLVLETSPLKILDGILKPHYKIFASNPVTKKLDPLLCLSFQYPIVNTIKTRSEAPRLYEEQIDRSIIDEQMQPILCASSLYGDYLKMTWNGGESVAEGGIGVEVATNLARARIHGGPITCCIRNPFYKDIVATIGGKTIAIWSGDSQEKPFMWKRMNYYLTYATWSSNIPSQMFVITYIGTIDIWDFLERSDLPVRSQTVSGSFLTGIYSHKLSLNQNYMGIANSLAFFRLFRIPRFLVESGDGDVKLTEKLFDRERSVINLYQNWNSVWEKKNEEVLNIIRKKTVDKFREKDLNAKLALKAEEDQIRIDAEKAEKLKSQTLSPEMKWKKLQWEGVEISIQIRKKLNIAQLQFEERPLTDIENQIKAKAKKMMEGLNSRQKVFEESVAILFPEVISQPAEVVHVKSEEEIKVSRKKCMKEYKDISDKAGKLIKAYEYTYVWENVALEGKDRRRYLDTCAAILAKRKGKIAQKLKEERTTRGKEI